jgi:hypothetical protein
MAECERTRAAYGETVELPVRGDTFVEHVRGLLAGAATKADQAYPDNAFFTIVNGRPKLSRQVKKPMPEGQGERAPLRFFRRDNDIA